MELFKRFRNRVREWELRRVSKLFEFHDNARLLEHNMEMLRLIIDEPLTITVKINAFPPCFGGENKITFTYKTKKYKVRLLHKNFFDIETLQAAIESFRFLAGKETSVKL